MSGAVVDTSIALKWVLAEEHTAEARALLEGWLRGGAKPRVPSWFACEIANVLYQHVREEKIGLEDARRGLRDVMAAVTVLDFDPDVAERALELAQRFRQPASYDTQYLALAERIDAELWTADRRFWRATSRAFPRVRWIGEAVSG